MYLSDLMSVKQWLIEKELLVPDPSPEEYEKSVDWVRRHLFVPLYTHKRGYAQVSKAAIENAYKIKKKFMNDAPTQRVGSLNKERAAVQLNAKNMAVKVYKGVYNFDTKERKPRSVLRVPRRDACLPLLLFLFSLRKAAGASSSGGVGFCQAG